MYSRFPEMDVGLPRLELLTDPSRWAEQTLRFYDSGDFRRSASYWGSRSAWGEGTMAQAFDDVGDGGGIGGGGGGRR